MTSFLMEISCSASWAPGFCTPVLIKVRCDVTGSQKDEGFIDHWLGLAECYSERDLTYESDKLPALSGLTTHFGQLHKQEYYAGI